jgi:hypothetical protein
MRRLSCGRKQAEIWSIILKRISVGINIYVELIHLTRGRVLVNPIAKCLCSIWGCNFWLFSDCQLSKKDSVTWDFSYNGMSLRTGRTWRKIKVRWLGDGSRGTPYRVCIFILFVSSFIECPLSRYLFLILFCPFSLSSSPSDADTCSECCGVLIYFRHCCSIYVSSTSMSRCLI